MKTRLQYISNPYAQLSHINQCKTVCDAGIRWFQLRLKGDNDFVKELEAVACKKICEDYKVTYIINDHVELAQRVDADGVHLGKDDMPLKKARQVLGKNKIIGGTANTFKDVWEIHQDANYVGLGPYRYTSTKKNLSPLLGQTGYIDIMTELKSQLIDVPVFAIGGIASGDLKILKSTGIHGIAVSNLLLKADNKKKVIENINKIFK